MVSHPVWKSLIFVLLSMGWAAHALAGVYFIHADHLGTPRVVSDQAGTVVWKADYDAFGKATLTTNVYALNLRFPGQYFDAETNLHYNYFRDYDPTVGRYLQSDPIGLDGGINPYTYVGSNPVRNYDPFGLEPWDWNGIGNTNVCSYYDKLVSKYPNCKYYKEAARICRGQNGPVNRLLNTGIAAAWSFSGLQDSQSVVYDHIRNALIGSDQFEWGRARGNACDNECPYGDDIDHYHEKALEQAGLSSGWYGGSWVPQNTWSNPVPYDSRGFNPIDDLFNALSSGRGR